MARLILLLSFVLIAGGCIQRSIRVDSQPQGALVYLNDVEVGRTPTTVPFTFYGVYDVRLEKAGYETLNTTEKAVAPLSDLPGIDLIAEVSPWRTNIQLDWFFTLEELRPVDEALTIERARQLRAEINPPATPAAPPKPTGNAAPPADEAGDAAPAKAGDQTPAANE
jgi:hypothetical protein